MGLLVSKYGIRPTEEKVIAVLESSRPVTPKEVRSFRGMVGFSALFIPNFATIAYSSEVKILGEGWVGA